MSLAKALAAIREKTRTVLNGCFGSEMERLQHNLLSAEHTMVDAELEAQNSCEHMVKLAARLPEQLVKINEHTGTIVAQRKLIARQIILTQKNIDKFTPPALKELADTKIRKLQTLLDTLGIAERKMNAQRVKVQKMIDSFDTQKQLTDAQKQDIGQEKERIQEITKKRCRV
jgi:hypothetical protein